MSSPGWSSKLYILFNKKFQLVPGSPEKECLSPMLLYSLSKTLHLNGTYSWYTFAENILNTNEITEKNIEVTEFNKEKWHLTKSLKKTLLENKHDHLFSFSQSIFYFQSLNFQ
jgi:hypothetical protein